MNKPNPLTYKNYLEKVKDDIASGANHRVLARSNSMRPFIVGWRDEIVLQQTDKNSFKKGTILLAELGGYHHVIHRLVKIDGDDLVLRGDAYKRHSEMCGRSDIIAEVVSVRRKDKIVSKGSFCWNYYRYLSKIIRVFNFA